MQNGDIIASDADTITAAICLSMTAWERLTRDVSPSGLSLHQRIALFLDTQEAIWRLDDDRGDDLPEDCPF